MRDIKGPCHALFILPEAFMPILLRILNRFFYLLTTCNRRETTSPNASPSSPPMKLFTSGACLNPSGSALLGCCGTASKSTVLTLLMAGL